MNSTVVAEEDRLLRAPEVQAQLGISLATVYRLMRENVLPLVRIGGSVRMPKKELTRSARRKYAAWPKID